MSTIMFQSPMGEMIILRHNTKTNKEILNKNVNYFGLFGGGKSATTLTY